MLQKLFGGQPYDPYKYVNNANSYPALRDRARAEYVDETNRNQEVQQICDQIRRGDYTNDLDRSYWAKACEIADQTADSDVFAGGGNREALMAKRLEAAEATIQALKSKTPLSGNGSGGSNGNGYGRMPASDSSDSQGGPQKNLPAQGYMGTGGGGLGGGGGSGGGGGGSGGSGAGSDDFDDSDAFNPSRTLGTWGRPSAPGIHPASLQAAEDNGYVADDTAVFFKGRLYNERFNRDPCGRANDWTDDMYGRGRPVAVPYVGRAKNPDAPTEYSNLTPALWATTQDTRRQTGVILNPYTGETYKTFEEDLPPPNRDYSKPDGFYNRPNRILIQAQGGFDPRNPPPSKREVANQMPGPDAGPNVWGEQLYAREIGERAAGYSLREIFNNRNGEVPVEAVQDRRPVGYLGFQNAHQFVPYLQPTQRGFEDTNAFANRDGLPDLTEMLWVDDRAMTMPLMSKKKPDYSNYMRVANVGGGEGSEETTGAWVVRPDALDIPVPQRAIDEERGEAFGNPDPGFEATLAEHGFETRVRPHLFGEEVVRWISVAGLDVDPTFEGTYDTDRTLPQRESYSEQNPIQGAHLEQEFGRAQTMGPNDDSLENQRASYAENTPVGALVVSAIYQGRADTLVAEEGTLRLGGLSETYEPQIGLPQDNAGSQSGSYVVGAQLENVPANKQFKSFFDLNASNLQHTGRQLSDLAAPRANLKQNATIHSQRAAVTETVYEDEFTDRDPDRDSLLPQRLDYQTRHPVGPVGGTAWQENEADRESKEWDDPIPQRNSYHAKNKSFAQPGDVSGPAVAIGATSVQNTLVPQRLDYHGRAPVGGVDADRCEESLSYAAHDWDRIDPMRESYSEDSPYGGVDPSWGADQNLEHWESDHVDTQRASYSGKTMVTGAGNDEFGSYVYDVPMLRPTKKDWSLHENPGFGVDAGEWGDVLHDLYLNQKGYRGAQEDLYHPVSNHVPDQNGGNFNSIQFEGMYNNRIGPVKESLAYDQNMGQGSDYSHLYSRRPIPKLRNGSIRPDDPVHRFSGYANPEYRHMVEV